MLGIGCTWLLIPMDETIMPKSYMRGHEIVFKGYQWVYADTLQVINHTRPCKLCEQSPTKEGYDSCTGHIEGAKSACCGHGVVDPYVLMDGIAHRGHTALTIINNARIMNIDNKGDTMETKAEREQRNKEFKQHIEYINTAETPNTPKKKNKLCYIECPKDPLGKIGYIECPKCSKSLTMIVSPDNGHSRGVCETKDCLNCIQ